MTDIRSRRAPRALCAALLAAACGGAFAQNAAGVSGVSGPYFGADLGRSTYRIDRGPAPGNHTDTAFKVYGGMQFDPTWGLELGYVNFGEIHRAGGTSKAQGANLSVVARLPLGDRFDIFGKVGSTYTRTQVTAAAGGGVASGGDRSLGLSYGIGGSYFLTPSTALTAGWDNHALRLAGSAKENVQTLSVGLRYRY